MMIKSFGIIVKCDIGCWLKIVDLIKDIVFGS